MNADYSPIAFAFAFAVDGADFEVQHTLDVADFEIRHIGIVAQTGASQPFVQLMTAHVWSGSVIGLWPGWRWLHRRRGRLRPHRG